MRQKIAILAILSFALCIRIFGIDWDSGQHLHPDERFLTMVTTATHLPSSLTSYFNPHTSPLNPRNAGFDFFVYGTFPLSLTKIVAVVFHKDNYAHITIIGRFLAAVFDVGTVLFVYFIARLWEKKYKLSTQLKLFAALFYSIAVLPIQQAHFFTVDSFLVFFLTGTLFLVLSYAYTRQLHYAIAAAIFFGLALASKISAVYMLPLFGALFLYSHIDDSHKRIDIRRSFILVSVFGVCSYLTVRLADPYFFASAHLFSPIVHPALLANFKQLASFNNPESFYPPGIQWIGKSSLFPLINIAFFGVGIPYFTLTIFGFVSFLKEKKIEWILIGGWLMIVLAYLSFQYVKSIRYFYLLYPYFAVFAAYGLMRITSLASRRKKAVTLILFLFVLIWPASFISIYTRPHSRVQASEWMYQNIPVGSVLAEEYWDDPLPLILPNVLATPFEYVPMAVFDPDSPAKWAKINETLARADYIVFSSNRGYASIMELPQKYPQMSQFYKDLFAEKLPFKKVTEFTSYPGLSIWNLHIPIDDQWSDEAFTVYDHPKVTIFKNSKTR